MHSSFFQLDIMHSELFCIVINSTIPVSSVPTLLCYHCMFVLSVYNVSIWYVISAYMAGGGPINEDHYMT